MGDTERHQPTTTIESSPDEPLHPLAQSGFAIFLVGSFVLAMALSRLLEPVPPPPSEEAPPPNVAVMPLYNLALEPETHYLSFALPAEVARALGQNPGLILRPFSQLRRYVDWDPQSVGRAVSAERVITGQFVVEDGELRLTLEAVHVDDNRVLFREGLSVPTHDIQALRVRLSSLIQQDLVPALGVRPVTKRLSPPQNSDGYDAFLRGSARAQSSPANAQAIAILEKSVEIDDSFAAAWAELAQRYYLAETSKPDSRPRFDKARRAADNAIRLDSDMIEPRSLLVMIATRSGETTKAFEIARELVAEHPAEAEARYAMSQVYRYAGLLEWSQRECDRSFAADRHNLRYRDCSWAFMRKGKFERAEDYISEEPDSDASRSAEAFKLLFQANPSASAGVFGSLSDSHPWKQATRCKDSAGAARNAFVESQRLLAATAFDPETVYRAAVILAFCRDHKGAFDALTRAAEGNYCASGAIVEEAPFAFLQEREHAASVRELTQRCQDRFVEHHSRITSRESELETR